MKTPCYMPLSSPIGIQAPLEEFFLRYVFRVQIPSQVVFGRVGIQSPSENIVLEPKFSAFSVIGGHKNPYLTI